MTVPSSRVRLARRALLQAVGWAGASGVLTSARADDPAAEPPALDEDALIRRLVGGPAMPSPRVRVQMPEAFGNGYSVPMTLSVESEMTEAEHVRAVHVLAPLNPIILVATYAFTPGSGLAAISTRIRLARSQDVLAVARMSDGALLLGRAPVKVDVDGCA